MAPGLCQNLLPRKAWCLALLRVTCPVSQGRGGFALYLAVARHVVSATRSALGGTGDPPRGCSAACVEAPDIVVRLLSPLGTSSSN